MNILIATTAITKIIYSNDSYGMWNLIPGRYNMVSIPSWLLEILFCSLILLLLNGVIIFIYKLIFKRIFRVSDLPFNKTTFTGEQILIRFLHKNNISDLKIVQKQHQYYFWWPWDNKVMFFNKSFYMNNVFSNSVALVTGSQLVMYKTKKWKYFLFYFPFSLKFAWVFWSLLYVGLFLLVIVKSDILLTISTSLILFLFLYGIAISIWVIKKNNHKIYNFMYQEKSFTIPQIKKMKKSISRHNFVLIWSFMFVSCFPLHKTIMFLKYIYKKII